MKTTAADSFWEFSLEIYRLPDVAERLIALQDEYGADVNVVLFCCWCGQGGRLPLDAVFFERVDGELGCWRQEVIDVLRRLRRHMKGGVRGISLEVSTPLREEIKRLELDAERVMQSALAALAPPVTGHGGASRTREALNGYFQHIGVAVTEDVLTLIDLLVAGTIKRG